MTTAQKRKNFAYEYKKEYKQVFELMDKNNWRELDEYVQSLNSAYALQYIITNLCDELTGRDNDNESED